MQHKTFLEMTPNLRNANKTVGEKLLLALGEWCYQTAQSASDTAKGSNTVVKQLHMLANYSCANPYIVDWLGSCYMQGYGVLNNPIAGIQYYLQAAKKHHSPAMQNLGIAYELDLGVPKNRDNLHIAANWYNESKRYLTAETKSTNTAEERYLNVALKLHAGQSGLEIYKAAAKGDQTAILVLEELAYASSPNKEALNILTRCYQRGEGVSQDAKKSHDLYRKASGLGCDLAQYSLGLQYEHGLGRIVAVDLEAAASWYYESATNMTDATKSINGSIKRLTVLANATPPLSNAIMYLGRYYFQKGKSINGVSDDEVKAFLQEESVESMLQTYYKKVVSEGDNLKGFSKQDDLDFFLKKSRVKIILQKYYKKIISEENCVKDLLQKYSELVLAKKYYEKALELFSKVAFLNDNEQLYQIAIYNIGCMYHFALGVDSDLSIANYWYLQVQLNASPEDKEIAERLMSLTALVNEAKSKPFPDSTYDAQVIVDCMTPNVNFSKWAQSLGRKWLEERNDFSTLIRWSDLTNKATCASLGIKKAKLTRYYITGHCFTGSDWIASNPLPDGTCKEIHYLELAERLANIIGKEPVVINFTGCSVGRGHEAGYQDSFAVKFQRALLKYTQRTDIKVIARITLTVMRHHLKQKQTFRLSELAKFPGNTPAQDQPEIYDGLRYEHHQAGAKVAFINGILCQEQKESDEVKLEKKKMKEALENMQRTFSMSSPPTVGDQKIEAKAMPSVILVTLFAPTRKIKEITANDKKLREPATCSP